VGVAGQSRAHAGRSPVGSIGMGSASGLWVKCHTEEFCMKVLKFEIVNSRKLFIYFSGVVPRTIEFVQHVMLFLGSLKMAC
jgi:hypothetical protein